ncbi:3-hydroxybutyrate dehydrogenase [Haematospirillum jordaniae]|uniref:3-hydroxybutyrate dehydrogenase n=1 Tax=Haematospirillum jordaniae TaxID=1549855 RepID=UPI00143342CA|nr:3-hydroxybutyrate dehydrogenase [Haematospirillum jordaniae]NKD84975.1 3-hydroxybutyrate dehydrogenase [Haematospirillum jordaniae]
MLKGKSAVVTGSTSGIGLGIASTLAAQGVRVMLNGLGDAAALERTRGELEGRYKVDVRLCPADLSKPSECSLLVDEAIKAFGSVDIVVNNAGIQFVSAVEAFPVEKWEQILSVNLSSAFHIIRTALPGMKKNRWGRIINIASAHGLVASVNKAAYVASKHGLVGLTKVVALENAEGHITCNAICPGWVRTPLVEPQIEARAKAIGGTLDDGVRSLVGEKQPSMRFSAPEDIGALAAFLCSDAAHNITGTTLSVDGGWTAQ